MPFVLRKICRNTFGLIMFEAQAISYILAYHNVLGAISPLTPVLSWHILINTCPTTILEAMPMSNCPKQPKHEMLRMHGCLNPHPDAVRDDLFSSEQFFDPHDMLQVKYEMLRRVRLDKRTVSSAAADFGLSRVSFYQVQESFDSQGVNGLLPRKRGPRDRHKLSGEVMRFVNDAREREVRISPHCLAQRIKQHFGIRVHARSIQRALAAQKKKLSARQANSGEAG